MIEILYSDSDVVFCVKPAGVSSEHDMPDMLAEQVGCEVYTVHRLDNPVGGIMVYAKNKYAAAKLCKQFSDNTDFEKTYLVVCEGWFEEVSGDMTDLLFKDSSRNKSFVVKKQRKGVKHASLSYRVVKTAVFKDKKLSLVMVRLHTGRSHQIRVQFASRKHPLFGDGKYGSKINGPVGLFSCSIRIGEVVVSKLPPDDAIPWNIFEEDVYNEL